MAFGKLYGFSENARTVACLAVAKTNKLDVELVKTQPVEQVFPENYRLLNKLGKIPTFEGADGFVLSECMAVAIYFASQNEKTTLLGKTKHDYASILRWMSFANTEVVSNIAAWYKPLVGREPYNKKHVSEGQEKTNAVMKVLDDHFLVNTYLVGDRLTLADVFTALLVARGFSCFFDKEWRSSHPHVTRWYETVTNQPIIKDTGFDTSLTSKAMPNQAPPKPEAAKHEKTKHHEKAHPKPKAADNEDDEPATPQEPKPKHPLEALGKPTLALDELKRTYSNEDTRGKALPWFWENVKFDEYSLYQVDYKYNEELTLIFMSANLIGGLFARLEASRKYLFGAMSVYGVTNGSIIRGAFLVRGQDAVPAFEVAPDIDSYTFTKLDPSKPEVKEFVNDMWAWDKPTTVNGKTYEWADGKVFK